MKTYIVTIFTRSNSCISPNKFLFSDILPATTIKNAKIDAWHIFDFWHNDMNLSRHDVRIEAKQFTAE